MRTLLAAACLLALFACGGSGPGLAGAPPRLGSADAGASPATPAADAGPAPDAGAPGDAGVLAGGGAADGGALSDAGLVAPASPALAGCPMFPLGNDWNRDVSGDAVDPHSTDYLSFMGAGSLFLHPDFGGQYGQPFKVVPGSQQRVTMSFLYSSQSDPGPYPFPPDLPIQAEADHHATVLDQGACVLYETYNTYAQGGGFHADSGARFDLTSGAPRPDGWTSATAAGLPILPGLARYDEAVELGEIRHALAFVAGLTAHAYVAPATHSAGTSSAAWAPPMGLRVRLRAGYDLSQFHGAALSVARALQRYGMFVTDTADGQFWSVAGAQDSRWSVPDLDQLKSIPVGAFEVVRLPAIKNGL